MPTNKLQDPTLPMNIERFGVEPSSFGIHSTSIFDEMINLFGEDNKQLLSGDHCFFLLWNVTDYFLPVICKGQVLHAEYTHRGQDKTYYIIPEGIVDDPTIVQESFDGKPFSVYKYKRMGNGTFQRKKDPDVELLTMSEFNTLKIHADNYFNRHNQFFRTFKTPCFYVRGYRTSDQSHYQSQLQKMVTFREEYVEFMKSDLDMMVRKMDFILTTSKSTQFQQLCSASQV